MVFPVIYTAQNYNLIGSLRSRVLPSYTGQLYQVPLDIEQSLSGKGDVLHNTQTLLRSLKTKQRCWFRNSTFRTWLHCRTTTNALPTLTSTVVTWRFPYSWIWCLADWCVSSNSKAVSKVKEDLTNLRMSAANSHFNLHGVISQPHGIFVSSAMRTSNHGRTNILLSCGNIHFRLLLKARKFLQLHTS